MAQLLLLSNQLGTSVEIIPSLELLSHQVKVLAAEPTALLDAPPADVILLDARRDLAGARSLCRLMQATGTQAPVLLVAAESGVAVLARDWGFADFVLAQAGPAEWEARIRILLTPTDPDKSAVFTSGKIEIDEGAYTARLDGKPLDLTYTEFELLKFLAQHPGRVFSRQQLLSDVWGYDYFGGTRTVDVHIRRLRAKLGTEYEALIGTVRNVGYRFVAIADT